MNKKLLSALIAAAVFTAIVGFFKFGPWGTSVLWALSDEGQWLLPLVAVAAVIDSVNPCAFSILLLTIAFLFSVGKLRSNILAMGGAYIAGMFAVYLAIGLGITGTLHLFDTPHFVGRIGAALLIALGALNLAGEFIPSFPIRIRIPHAAHRAIAVLAERGTIPAAVVLGGLVGLCEFPCTGGPYLMVLGLLHDSATYLRGLAYLVFYNLIFVAPLIVLVIIASDRKLLETAERFQREQRALMKIGGGIAMLILGSAILFL